MAGFADLRVVLCAAALATACAAPKAVARSVYIADCGGAVVRFDEESLKPLGAWQATKLGWAPAVSDGCVINSLTYDAAHGLLWAVAPMQPTVDAQGQRQYGIVAWDAADGKLEHRIRIAEPLTSTPNLLVEPDGRRLKVAFEAAGGVSGSAEITLPQPALPSANLSRPVELTKLARGAWFAGGPVPAPAAKPKPLESALSGALAYMTPDGKRAVSVARSSCAVSAWDWESGKKIASAEGAGGPCELACAAPDASAVIRAGSKLLLFSPSVPKLRPVETAPAADPSTECVFGR